MLQRRMEAQSRLPPLSSQDSLSVNLRSILLERAALGFEDLTENRISQIKKFGYDAFLINFMNSESKIGHKKFFKLKEIGRLELTNEYIVFHNFRDRLKPEIRKKIAKFLLHETQ